MACHDMVKRHQLMKTARFVITQKDWIATDELQRLSDNAVLQKSMELALAKARGQDAKARELIQAGADPRCARNFLDKLKIVSGQVPNSVFDSETFRSLWLLLMRWAAAALCYIYHGR